MVQVVTFVNKRKEDISNEGYGIDLSYFTDENNQDLNLFNTVSNNTNINTTPKKGRPKKTKTMSDGSTVVTTEDSRELQVHETNEPYENSYKETNYMLKSTIAQIDSLSGDIGQELMGIKASKTLKRKYEYISELTNTSSSLLNTKLSAIREINKTITDCHNLEMKRIKELKLNVDAGDDDKHMMDMYNAFINTPVSGNYQLAPSMTDMTLFNPTAPMVRADVNIDNADMGYNNYMNTLTPEQNRMIMEHNPNIKTVLMYDQDTNNRWFEVIDSSTGQKVPNMPIPSDLILQNTTINLSTGKARNADIESSYDVIVLGQSKSIMDY